MTLQELEQLVTDCKTRKSHCLKSILESKGSKKEEFMLERVAEHLAAAEIGAQIAYVYALRDKQDPNAQF
jgi:hypothetical protein